MTAGEAAAPLLMQNGAPMVAARPVIGGVTVAQGGLLVPTESPVVDDAALLAGPEPDQSFGKLSDTVPMKLVDRATDKAPHKVAPVVTGVVAAPLPAAAPIPEILRQGRDEWQDRWAQPLAVGEAAPLPPAVAEAGLRMVAPAVTEAVALGRAATPQPRGAIAVATDSLGAVRIGIEGSVQDLQVSLGLSPAAAAIVAADVPRLIADLAANGVRLQSLDVTGGGTFGGQAGGQSGGQPGQPGRAAAMALNLPAALTDFADTARPRDRFA